MFWNRHFNETEHAFVHRFFAHSLAALQPRLRVYLRRVGDTHRALSLNGGRIYMPRACFVDGDPTRSLRLSHPYVAGVFAHELLHQWQRVRGVAVTRQAAWLQTKAVCLRRDPYAYEACDDAALMLARFVSAQVEQQGQMWQDYVTGCVAGHADPAFAEVAAYVAGSPVVDAPGAAVSAVIPPGNSSRW
ncbi:hypothetical protein [Diaphorobacter aerolatus]|uniref:hypothetical protein n=1 Tax=Diaphorobacter aerolatus TaxID=1288495 RepID=UPI001D031353|nr:hypothetical protein [Diaphorobacter aerolatus]